MAHRFLCVKNAFILPSAQCQRYNEVLRQCMRLSSSSSSCNRASSSKNDSYSCPQSVDVTTNVFPGSGPSAFSVSTPNRHDSSKLRSLPDFLSRSSFSEMLEVLRAAKSVIAGRAVPSSTELLRTLLRFSDKPPKGFEKYFKKGANEKQ
ncbi:hypothetical protein FHG87_019939, partial [Trinorchestia longiramus]